MKLKKKNYPYMYIICIILIIAFSAINCITDDKSKNKSKKKANDPISNILF
jgi:hypothetical protein